MENKLKIGIIGADSKGRSWGAIAHIPALQNISSIELVALCNSSAESAIAAGKFYGIERVYHDVKEFVNQPDIDIVAVVVRIPNHFEMVQAALNAGKHVYCEWPLGATIEETTELAELAETKGVNTAIGLQGQHDPSLNYIKELYKQGWFGTIYSIQMTHLTKGSSSRPSREAWQAEIKKGAHLFNVVGGHTISYVIHCFGPIKELSAKISIQHNPIIFEDTGETEDSSIPDTILVHGEMENESAVSISIMATSYHSEGWRLRVNGSEGTIIATSDILPQIAPIKLMGAKGSNDLIEMKIPSHHFVSANSPLRGPPMNLVQAYTRFADAINEGKPYSPNFSDALVMERVLHSIIESSSLKKSIRLGKPIS